MNRSKDWNPLRRKWRRSLGSRVRGLRFRAPILLGQPLPCDVRCVWTVNDSFQFCAVAVHTVLDNVRLGAKSPDPLCGWMSELIYFWILSFSVLEKHGLKKVELNFCLLFIWFLSPAELAYMCAPNVVILKSLRSCLNIRLTWTQKAR